MVVVAKFDIRTGKALTMPATADTLVHEVKVEGQDVRVQLRDNGFLPIETALTHAR